MSSDCTTARRWLSAERDGEALPDTVARSHVESCDACTAWESTLSTVTRRMTLRTAATPDVTRAGLAAWAERAEQPHATQARVARTLLGIAGIAGLLLAGATAVGLVGPTGAHSTSDLVAMESALAFGFLLGAWRPDRYSRGLLPVAVVAGLLTLTTSASQVSGSTADMVREAAHLPVLLGMLGLFVLLDASGSTIPRQRR